MKILFRAKRVDTGEWVYGAVIENPVDKEVYIGRYEYSKFSKKIVWDVDIVIPETIGQYVGRDIGEEDKIFGGDIFGYFEPGNSEPVCYGVVKYRTDYEQYRSYNTCGFVIEWKESSKVPIFARNLREDLPFWCISYSNARKVGNIHDNAELLRK